MKTCVKCGTKSTIPIDSADNPSSYYCPECDTAFHKNDVKQIKGKLEFGGVSPATQIVHNIYQDFKDVSLEEQSVVLAQITGLTLEQWLEGFKAGQLATAIFHRSKSNDGKNRDKPRSTNREYQAGANNTGANVSNGEDCSSKSSNTSTAGRPKRIREYVDGIEFNYAEHLVIPGNIYILAAELSKTLKESMNKKFSFTYSGVSLNIVIQEFN